LRSTSRTAQRFDELDLTRVLVRRGGLPHVVLQLCDKLVGRFVTIGKEDECLDHVAPQLVRAGDIR
jgi:hypothetical protein